MKKYDIVIIGGGIIGGAIAFELSKFNLKVMVLEKNPCLADETSRGNSGVIHGGFDPRPEKINAKLNIRGLYLWKKSVFPYLKFPRQQIDSLVVAFNHEEMQHIHMLYNRGITNGVKASDMKILDQKALLSREKHLNPKAIGALLCTSSWAIDPVKASLAFFNSAKQNDIEISTNSEVTNIETIKPSVKGDEQFLITINNQNKIVAANIINAAGHYADIIAQKAHQNDFNLIARRGQYRILSHSQANLVKAIYFMVPTIHGKGVVVAPMLDGRVLVGPTAEENIPKDQTRLVTPEMYDLIGKIGHQLIPSLDLTKTEMTFAGSRPIEPISDDFVIIYGKSKHFINVAGTKSPGLSSAPAIAELVILMLKENGTKLQKKHHWNPEFTLIS